MPEEMNIAFCISENYALFLQTALVSILRQAAPEDKFHFYIVSEGLSPVFKEQVQQLQSIKPFHIDYLDIDCAAEMPDFPTTDIWKSKLCYTRIKLPLLLRQRHIHVKRLLYLDADIVALHSLSMLYHTPLNGWAAGFCASRITDEELDRYHQLQLPRSHHYFYSGLILFDTQKYIEQKHYERACTLARQYAEKLYWPDMDLLNLMFSENQYCILPPAYSVLPYFNYEPMTRTLAHHLRDYAGVYPEEQIRQAFFHPVIWQLAGSSKPTSPTVNWLTMRTFYRYAKQTAYKKQARRLLLRHLKRNLFRKDKQITDSQVIRRYTLFNCLHWQTTRVCIRPELTLGPQTRCLLVHPHPDDEIIGCGGVLATYAAQFDTLCLSSSGVSWDLENAKYCSDTRIREFHTVMDALGIARRSIFTTYGQPPFLDQIKQHMPDYLAAVDFGQYDYIFLPQPHDTHPEHRYITRVLMPQLFKKSRPKKNVKIVFYEVWGTLEQPNFFFPMQEALLQRKLELLRLYASQIDDTWNYPRWVAALNTYRSMQATPHPYAEAYFMTGLKEYLRLCRRYAPGWKERRRELKKKIYALLFRLSSRTGRLKKAARKPRYFRLDKTDYQYWQARHAARAAQLARQHQAGRKIKVGFLVHWLASWSAENVLRQMQQNPLFEVSIIVAPVKNIYDAATAQQVYQENLRLVQDAYGTSVPVLPACAEDGRLLPGRLNGLDLLFIPSNDERIEPAPYQIYQLLRQGILPCYICYSYYAVKNDAIQSDTYNLCWKVFLENELNKQDLLERQPLRGQNAVVTGYPKADDFARYTPRPHTRKRILIAPHHSIHGQGLASQFLKYADFFLQLPEKYPQVDFIFRPHPLLYTNLIQPSYWGLEKTEAYLKRLQAFPNMQYDTTPYYFQTFMDSDGIIHDCGSFLPEYLFTDHPACYMLPDPQAIDKYFGPFGKACLDVYYQAYTAQDLTHFIEEVILQGKDPLQARRRAFAAQAVRYNYPHAAHAVVQELQRSLTLTLPTEKSHD